MKAALVALTKRGAERAQTYASVLPQGGDIYIHETSSEVCPQGFRFGSLREIMPVLWTNYRLLVFIMATGIVSRLAAPLLQGKERDPAVLAGDEAGQFIIPLLSGHLGGANAWAEFLAQETGATAVVTTATDVNGLVAPDEYARRFGWKVEPVGNLKRVNRRLLECGFLTIWADQPLPEEHPLRQDPCYIYLGRYDNESQGQIFSEQARKNCDVLVSILRKDAQAAVKMSSAGEDITPAEPSKSREKTCTRTSDIGLRTSIFEEENESQVRLVPRILGVGVGCRRGVPAELILEGLENALKQIKASRAAVKGLYSIDRKADEVGLQQAASLLGVPFVTYSAEEIQKVNVQYKLKQSLFVRNELGVDGVCEAASLLGTNRGELLLNKYKERGMTIAVSREKSILSGSAPEIPNI